MVDLDSYRRRIDLERPCWFSLESGIAGPEGLLRGLVFGIQLEVLSL